MKTTSILATAPKIGAYTLANRVVMAPLTRMRANADLAPYDLTATYYAQRASAGLIITEASQISQQGQGYPATPAIYSAAQIEGWKKVNDAVHAENGHIFIQLWHVGRISHSSHQPDNKLPVSASAIAAPGNAFASDFSRVPYETPHALTVEEIQQVLADYKQAAIHAKEAGFDGIEIHAANGYLIEQFLRESTNKREDQYGGSQENRARFLFEVLETVLSVWPADKVAIRLSPLFTGTISADPDPLPIYDYVVKRLAPYHLAYLHIIESVAFEQGFTPENKEEVLANLLVKRYRALYSNPIIAANGFTKESAEAVVEAGYADAIAFGTAYISTPDLAYRLIEGIASNEPNPSTFYGGGAEGYTDYPTHK